MKAAAALLLPFLFALFISACSPSVEESRRAARMSFLDLGDEHRGLLWKIGTKDHSYHVDGWRWDRLPLEERKRLAALFSEDIQKRAPFYWKRDLLRGHGHIIVVDEDWPKVLARYDWRGYVTVAQR